jgi:uncharacterized protein (DUF1501 family)
MKRRNFLKLSLSATLYTLSTNLQADTTDDGYKAIVVVYLAGGNDSLNMFIPSSQDPKKGYENYANIRNNIKVSNTPLSLQVDGNGELDLSGANPYEKNGSLSEAYTKGFYTHTDDNGDDLGCATNPLMPELAHLVNRKKVAIISNCGNLIEPATKAEFQAKTKSPPPFLYAHNHQTKLTFNGVAAQLDYTGWAGRVYDHFKNLNGGDIYGMNISVGGVTHLFDAQETAPLYISPNGPTRYNHIKEDFYNEFLDLPRRNMFYNLYNNMRKHSVAMQNTIVDDWQNNAPDFRALTNAYKGELFSKPTDEQLSQTSGTTKADTSMLNDLRAVAKLAKIGKDRGLKREIFFVSDGGYDTHSNQTHQHAKKLRGLSLGIGDFYKALEFMGMENEVTLITVSDFGRSTGNNDDGSDHAWGGNYFVLGGSVKGGRYGVLPDLTLGSDDDYTHKGRLIPTTSNTQYIATVLKWFGIDQNNLLTILPELQNFPQKDLGFMS